MGRPRKSNRPPVPVEDLSSEGKNFGGYLRSIRESREMTLKSLAKEVDMEANYLGEIERETRYPPNAALLERLMVALHVQHIESVFNTLYDLAAAGRQAVSPDIAPYIMESPHLRALIRRGKKNGYGNAEWEKLLQDISEA